jgi:hypothetical protein
MIGIQDAEIARQPVQGAVGERVAGLSQAAGPQHSPVRHPAQRNNQTVWRQLCYLGAQEAAASGQLGGNREIARGQTLDRIGDPAIAQLQTVIDGAGLGAVAEAEAMQTSVQQLAGLITGKRPPAGVGAVQAGREPHYQQAGFDGPKGRHRT